MKRPNMQRGGAERIPPPFGHQRIAIVQRRIARERVPTALRSLPFRGGAFLLDKSNPCSYISEMQSCRFTFAVHVMAVLALEKADCCSSSRLAQTVNTNPVVIRRLLIELQDAGLISTFRGPHGGALLKRKPEKLTLREIHRAVDHGSIFGTHPNEPSQECPVGKSIGKVMERIQDRANRALERELEKMTLADVLRELRRG
jgi:Rrf2 family protein